MPEVSVWPAFLFSWKAVPQFSKDYTLHILNSHQNLVRDELLLEEWHSWTVSTYPSSHPSLPLDRHASCSRTWEVDAASNELGFPILRSGFSEAIVIPGLLDAIGLDTEEERVAMEEDWLIAANRDLDTTLSSSLCSGILFATVEQLCKLKFMV